MRARAASGSPPPAAAPRQHPAAARPAAAAAGRPAAGQCRRTRLARVRRRLGRRCDGLDGRRRLLVRPGLRVVELACAVVELTEQVLQVRDVGVRVRPVEHAVVERVDLASQAFDRGDRLGGVRDVRLAEPLERLAQRLGQVPAHDLLRQAGAAGDLAHGGGQPGVRAHRRLQGLGGHVLEHGHGVTCAGPATASPTSRVMSPSDAWPVTSTSRAMVCAKRLMAALIARLSR